MPSTGTPDSKIACGARGEPVVVHRGRAAGEDHRLRLHLGEGGFRLLERHDLGIDALLAHPARDQLRHLGAEIDDQNLVMRRGHCGEDRRRRRGLCWGLSWRRKYATGRRLATGKCRLARTGAGHLHHRHPEALARIGRASKDAVLRTLSARGALTPSLARQAGRGSALCLGKSALVSRDLGSSAASAR